MCVWCEYTQTQFPELSVIEDPWVTQFQACENVKLGS